MKMVSYTRGLLEETAGCETDWESSQVSHHSARAQTTTPWNERHYLEVFLRIIAMNQISEYVVLSFQQNLNLRRNWVT